jgi:hypothetical protein
VRRLGCALLLIGVLGSSCGATLTVRYTAPSQLNGGTCAVRALSPSPAWPMMIHFAWSGPAAGEDSLTADPGQSGSWTRRNLPAGLYTVRGWPSNAYGVGCDTTITRTAGDPPAPVAIQ